MWQYKKSGIVCQLNRMAGRLSIARPAIYLLGFYLSAAVCFKK